MYHIIILYTNNITLSENKIIYSLKYNNMISFDSLIVNCITLNKLPKLIIRRKKKVGPNYN